MVNKFFHLLYFRRLYVWYGGSALLQILKTLRDFFQLATQSVSRPLQGRYLFLAR
jgi:hypothetical protein